MTATDPAAPVVDRARPLSGRQRLLALGIAAVAGAVYVIYALTRWSQFLTAGYDLGIFDQAVNHYAHFRLPYVALKGPHTDLLGDHFHPIIALWAPLYWIWSDPRMLLIAQGVLIAASIPIIHRLAVRTLGVRVAWAWTGAYALGWPLQAMVGFDVHEVAFAVPICALVLDALDRRDDRWLWLWCGALLLVREDMGAIVACVGILRLLRPPRRWHGAGLVALGVTALVVTVTVIIPLLSVDGHFGYWSYGALGNSVPSAMAHVATDPLGTLRLFFSPAAKSQTLLYLLLPWLLLSLRSPYVLPVLPMLAERFFSSRPTLWSVQFHYSAVVWPLLTVAAFDGARRLRLRGRTMVLAGVSAVVLAIPILGTAIGDPVFVFHRVVDRAAFAHTAHMSDQAAIIALIPAGTCVEADDYLAPRLTHTNLVSIPGHLGRAPDFLALDLYQRTPGKSEPLTRVILARHLRAGYRVVARRGTVVLLRRPGYTGPSSGCGPFGEG